MRASAGTLSLVSAPTPLSLQSLATVLSLLLVLLMWVDDADAWVKDGSTLAGRAVRNLAAAPVYPMDYPLPAAIDEAAPQAHPPALAGGSLGGLFSRPGLVGGFAAGFLGTGLLGVLFGRGMFGGLGGVASYLGLLFQLTLLVMLCRLIWTRWRGGDAAAFAALSPRQLADPYMRSRSDWLPGGEGPAAADDTMHDGEEAAPANDDAAGDPKLVETAPPRDHG